MVGTEPHKHVALPPSSLSRLLLNLHSTHNNTDLAATTVSMFCDPTLISAFLSRSCQEKFQTGRRRGECGV